MHPILIRIPLPAWELPLFGCLLFVALVGAISAGLGVRSRATDLVVMGGAVAIFGLLAAIAFRTTSYALESLPLNSYGAMLALSLGGGWFLTLRLAERDGLDRATAASCFFVTALAALLGARLLYVLTNVRDFHSLADVLALRRGGLVAYGGFLGGLVGSWLFLRSRRSPLMPWADVAVPSVALGVFLTRVGCYLFGCDFGRPLSDGAPRWLRALGSFPRWDESVVRDVSGSPAWTQHVALRGLAADAEASLPVHPTQLYEALAGLALLGFVFVVRRRKAFAGEVFLAFTFAYGFLRFIIEIVRDDAERGTWGPKLAAHVYVPIMLLVFAAAFTYGPARSLGRRMFERAGQLASPLPALAAWLWLRPGDTGRVLVQLSTSQWIGLITAIAAGIAWSTLSSNQSRSST